MEDESNFEKLPKVSIKSLISEKIFEDISIVKNGIKTSHLIILKNGREITIPISKKTSEKIKETNNYDEIIINGHIVLINNLLSTNSLRFYTNEYQNLDDYFEPLNDDKKRIKKDCELIIQIISNS